MTGVPHIAHLLAGAGAMAEHYRQADWARSPVGPVSEWPSVLVHTVSLMLPARAEIVLFWGPEYVAFYNEAYAPTIGDKHPRALGRPAAESWTELWSDLRSLLDHVVQTGETYTAKDRPFYIKRHGYGETAYFDISYSAVRGDDGAVAGVLCIVSETTARVSALESARMTGETLRLATDAAEIGTWDLDCRADILRWSDRTKAMFGLPPEAEVSMADFNTGVHPDDIDATMAAFNAALDPEQRAVYDVEYRTVDPQDGRIRWVAAKGRGFFEGDACVRAIGTVRDITPRRQREAELRETEARFRTLADAVPALIWVTDARGQLTFTNEWFATMLGRTADEIRDGGWAVMLHPDDRAHIAEQRERAFSAQRPWGREMRLVKRGGDIRWVHAEARPRMINGQFAGFIGCAVDITEAHLAAEALERGIAERTRELADANAALRAQIAERERIEAALVQMQKLEAIGQLTSGVAHDFNNLLTVVLGNVSMIERSAADVLDARALQRLAHVRMAAERGATLTQQLLAFSRRQRLEGRVVDLNAAMERMLGLLRSSLGATVAIETRLADALWPALVDPTQLELIVLNLAINARDAMDGGGTLTLTTANVERAEPERAEEPPAGAYVCVAVQDTGTGMSEAVLARAFEPFFTTKEVGRGSGLGLAQVFGFAKQSGGGVSIATTPGAGTTVSVYLPRAEDQAPDAPEDADDAGATRRLARTVLVVDDDDAVRAVTADTLRDSGCTVVEATSGEGALECLGEATPIDVAVVDFAMPGMNGAAFAEHASALRPALPILFVTGYADLGALASVPDERILQKPYATADLLGRLRRLTG